MILLTIGKVKELVFFRKGGAVKPKKYPYNLKKKIIKIENPKTLREEIIEMAERDLKRLEYNPNLIKRKNGKVYEWKN